MTLSGYLRGRPLPWWVAPGRRPVIRARRDLTRTTVALAVGAGLLVGCGVLAAGADPTAGALDRWLIVGLTVAVVALFLSRVNRHLYQRAAMAEAVAQLGQRALRVSEPDELLTTALTVAVEALGTEYGTALRRLPDGGLRVAAELGPDTIQPGTVIPLAASGSYAMHVVESAEPFVSRDLRRDPRITPPVPLIARGIVSGVAVPVPGVHGALGVLAVHATRRRWFPAHEVALLQAMANIVATAWEQVAFREQLSHQALHDPLTGLANRALLLDRLEQALSRRPSGRADEPGIAVALIDLDRFKSVNDGLGHAAGDVVLQTVGRRLAAAVRPSDTLARFGGDEFAMLCEHVSEEHVTDLTSRMVEAATMPVEFEGTVLTVTASVGVTLTSPRRHGANAEDLLREADIALYRAKDHGGNRIELFNERMQAQAQARVKLEAELRTAIDRDQLCLHYQPIRTTAGQHLVSLEALVRWRHPERGLLPPDDFLPLAEQTGLIVPLGRWVLQEACRQTARWQRELGGRPVRIAVNVSPRQLDDPELAALVTTTIAASGLVPGTLTLEITETALLDGGDAAHAALNALVTAGASLVLDDFGTGYSSLTHLARFPIQALKIDRSFVAGLDSDSRDAVIVAAVIALGAELGLNVIAEGVENERQLEMLLQMGCPAVQGYLLDRPLPQPSWTARLPLQRLSGPTPETDQAPSRDGARSALR
ncbi:putative bifunctional diguanylate cyclase/phosphodiesterase [Nakamurella deserti]|uniref:putative bifunctional diguanylate cyclase/phosphodiesterase n=1 Tax=Nakamurella deserti TaxID=2164074 RepID=UPI000DBE708C|nr:EAL domain-containing protein [Nakamurella deserti]